MHPTLYEVRLWDASESSGGNMTSLLNPKDPSHLSTGPSAWA